MDVDEMVSALVRYAMHSQLTSCTHMLSALPLAMAFSLLTDAAKVTVEGEVSEMLVQLLQASSFNVQFFPQRPPPSRLFCLALASL